ncbi:MAG TPA: bifunctional phosphopantothenoylcysteine decarboxylase/phosphopantothenate--cysteine ligase CoaBC [Dehalococcoidia bacterium]|nr:bifunctional phosphopantothenoylcysteine decarboxylase/phosphopantothenate--cysteine ligase CoaBC [Dehalococcoidia bacterium]
MLKGKTIVLGITGSIAAYKAADMASKLTQAGAIVNVIMTAEAMQFITPLTLRSLTGRPVVTSMWELSSEFSVEHVSLAEAADIFVIAPATANVIAKIAAGIADDMLTTSVLDTSAPILISPAMHSGMYENKITQENIARLQGRGFQFIGPSSGRLASGGSGSGRFIEVSEIISAIDKILAARSDLSGLHIVITAGGTQEAIDPVRCITNHSSGKMGYALAEAARNRGARVILITAPTSLPVPADIDIVPVISAEDMLKEVKKATRKSHALIMAAAVADYRPKEVAKNKIKRHGASRLTLELERTPDILAAVEGNFVKVGFAAESQKLMANARDKLRRKNLDMIVANDVTSKGCGFGSDNNQVIIIDRKGKTEELPLMSKKKLADKILDSIVRILP